MAFKLDKILPGYLLMLLSDPKDPWNLNQTLSITFNILLKSKISIFLFFCGGSTAKS